MTFSAEYLTGSSAKSDLDCCGCLSTHRRARHQAPAPWPRCLICGAAPESDSASPSQCTRCVVSQLKSGRVCVLKATRNTKAPSVRPFRGCGKPHSATPPCVLSTPPFNCLTGASMACNMHCAVGWADAEIKLLPWYTASCSTCVQPQRIQTAAYCWTGIQFADPKASQHCVCVFATRVRHIRDNWAAVLRFPPQGPVAGLHL